MMKYNTYRQSQWNIQNVYRHNPDWWVRDIRRSVDNMWRLKRYPTDTHVVRPYFEVHLRGKTGTKPIPLRKKDIGNPDAHYEKKKITFRF